MNEIELKEYLKQNFPKEDERCEWKAFTNLRHAVSGHKGEDVISYVSAISNMQGGHLVIGVEDKTLNILGIQEYHDYTAENLPFRIMGNCTHLKSEGLVVEQIITSDSKKTVWVLHIPKHFPRKAVVAHKMSWQRKGDILIPLTPEREQIILNEPLYRNDDWSAIVCDKATYPSV